MLVLPPRILRGVLQLAVLGLGLALFLVGIRVPVVFITAGFGLLWQNSRRMAAAGWSHGTARIATIYDLIRSRFLGREGLILGTTANLPRPTFREGLSALWSASQSADMACFLFLSALGGTRWVGERIIRISSFTHLMTCAPTGRGKGVSVLIPNLRSYPHSCVVNDPKGELYTLTASIRYHKLKNTIILLAPFGIPGSNVSETDRLNPLDFIDDTADDFLDQCRDLADMMVVQSKEAKEPYWDEAARSVLTAFIAYVCACESNPAFRTIDTVRELVSSRSSFSSAIADMQKEQSHNGVIARLGHQMAWHEGKELASTLSNVQRHTEAFDSPPVAKSLSSSTFAPRSLRSGRVTIYLCLPHDKLETLAPLMRIWIGTILRAITRGQVTERNPVLFLLDECAHIGKIRVLEQAVTLMRGMGVRLWFFFQSLSQLDEIYGDKAKTILDNIDTHQHFAVNHHANADALSTRIGDMTIALHSWGENGSHSRPTGSNGQDSGSVTTGWNTNVSETGRRVFKPEELLVMPEDTCLIFHRNMPVIVGRLLKYYNHPSFKNFGTGEQSGLGRTATEKAVCLLLSSLLLVLLAVNLALPSAPPMRVPPHARPDATRIQRVDVERSDPPANLGGGHISF